MNVSIYFVTTMLIGFTAVISVVLANASNILNRQPLFCTNETFIYIFILNFCWLKTICSFFSISFSVGTC